VQGRGPALRGGLAVAGAAIAMTGAMSAPAVAQERSCGWTVVGGGSEVNVLYPDASATYFVSNLPIPDGGYMEYDGSFPHARYMSFTTFTGQQQSIDGLHDTEIVPDPGSSNPYLPHARRDVEQRDFTVRVVKQQAPADGSRDPNTVYTTNADGSRSGSPISQRVTLRVYAPDRGLGPEGGVPLPTITVVTADGQRTTLPECPFPDVPDAGLTTTLANAGSGEPAPTDTTVRGEDPPRWRKFTGTGASLTDDNPLLRDLGGEGGFGDNPDNKYVYTYFAQAFGEVLVLRAKAPTFPATYDGQERMGTGQLRYWSFCSNTQTTQVYACRQDDQIVTDRLGYYTIVISTAAARPKTATEACGVTWLPAGALPSTLLILRNMLPDPSFAQAIQNTEPGTEEQTMGSYYPRGKYYATTADYERLGCGGLL